MIQVWYDGACGPNNPGGHAGSGISIKENNQIIYQESYYLGYGETMSNNVAEYLGVIRALTYLLSIYKHNDKIVCYGDSKLTIMQMNKRWRCRKGLYKQYYLQACFLLKQFKNISFIWIPRHQNEDADELSKVAIETQSISAYSPSYAPTCQV